MNKLIDDIVICVTVVFCLGIALFLAFSVVERNADYPPTLITLFLGIAVAALTYRFLGGSQDAEFRVGVLKLGGSAALLLGTTFIIGQRIRGELNIFDDSQTYIVRIDQITSERDKLGKELAERDQENADLRTKLENLPNSAAVVTLAQIQKMAPTDPLVKGLRRMIEAQQGPFRQTIKDMEARVALAPMPGNAALYSICQDTFDKLYQGAEPNSNVLVSRSVGPDNVDTNEQLDRHGRIGLDVCQSPKRDFDIQIGCSTAIKLFPDMIKTCAEGAKIRGQRVTLGALP